MAINLILQYLRRPETWKKGQREKGTKCHTAGRWQGGYEEGVSAAGDDVDNRPRLERHEAVQNLRLRGLFSSDFALGASTGSGAVIALAPCNQLRGQVWKLSNYGDCIERVPETFAGVYHNHESHPAVFTTRLYALDAVRVYEYISSTWSV